MTSFTSLVCPVIVGRTHQLDTLASHLDDGGPPVLVVSGEAGIGKSRLIAEAKRRARGRGMQELQGACYESDRVLPYAPLLDLLRALFATVSLEESAPAVGAAAAELAVLLPGLSRRAPAPVVPAIAEPPQHRSRVFYALSDLVAALAATSPLLVIVEDLHWSDEASLDFLASLARHIVPYGHCSTTPASGGGGAAAEPHAADAPIRLVLSYRSDEPHPTLLHVLAGLERERLAIELGLVRLTRDQLEAMVRAIFTLHDPIPFDVLHMLHRLTDGNPFFVEEVLTSLVELGDLSYAGGIWMRKPLGALRIPRTIHDAVQRRTTGLSGAARQLLTVAAVAGQRFDCTLLQHLTQRDEPALLASIKELMAHQLVVEESADRFAFRHALTREAVYADLLARERRQLHRAIAEALEARAPDVPGISAGDLAYHFYSPIIFDAVGKHAFRRCRGSLKPGGLYIPTDGWENLCLAVWTAGIGDKRVVLGIPPPAPPRVAPAPAAPDRAGRCGPCPRAAARRAPPPLRGGGADAGGAGGRRRGRAVGYERRYRPHREHL